MLSRSGISDHMSGLSRFFAGDNFLRVLLRSLANVRGVLALITASFMFIELNIGIPFIFVGSTPDSI